MAVQAGGNMVWLAVVGVLSSAVGAYYYLRVLVFMFMKDPQAGAPVAVPMRSAYVVTAIVIAGFLVMALGLMPGALLELAVRAASTLLPA